MRNRFRKLSLLLGFFITLSLASGSMAKNFTPNSIPGFAGIWDFTFYDASGKMQGKKTLEIAEDGSISGKVVMNIDNTIYNTEVSANITKNGKVNDGTLTDTDRLEMVGSMTGTFIESEGGKGTWKNYYGKSGTWEAKRSEKEKR